PDSQASMRACCAPTPRVMGLVTMKPRAPPTPSASPAASVPTPAAVLPIATSSPTATTATPKTPSPPCSACGSDRKHDVRNILQTPRQALPAQPRPRLLLRQSRPPAGDGLPRIRPAP